MNKEPLSCPQRFREVRTCRPFFRSMFYTEAVGSSVSEAVDEVAKPTSRDVAIGLVDVDPPDTAHAM